MRTFLSNLALQLPVLLVLGVGIVMAIVRWKKAPRTALLTLIGMVIIGFVTVLSVVINSFLYYFLNNQFDMDYRTIDTTFKVLGGVFNLLTAGGWVLVLIAIFDKKKSENQ
jgi:membrane protein YdbS with pleckstrin-like domain